MHSLLRFALPVGFIALLFAISCVVFFQSILLHETFPFALLSLLVLVTGLARFWDRRWLGKQSLGNKLFYFLGFLIPLSPMCGLDFILCVGVCLTGGAIIKDRQLFPWYGFACVLYLLIWGFSSLILELPNLSWFAADEGWNPIVGIQSFSQLAFALLLFVAFALFRIWSLVEETRVAAARGILIGGVLSLALSVIQVLTNTYQILETLSLEFPRQTLLWNSLGRSVGTFTDPNAYGIFCGLFIALLCMCRSAPRMESSKWRQIFVVGVLLAFIGGGLSGSRTFFLFLALFGVSYLFISLIYSDNSKARYQHIAIIVGASLILFALIFGVNMPATVRVRETMMALLQGDLSLVENRLQFSRLCIEAFRLFPVFGVGPLLFPSYLTSLSEKLGIPMGLWVDNTNNTYLGIVAEFGLVGLFILSLVLFSAHIGLQRNLSLKLANVRVSIAAYLSFALILVLGPHYFFPEVLLTFTLLLALRLQITDYRRTALFLSVVVVIAFAPATFLAAARTELGLFAWEIAPETKEKFRWSQERFRTWILCDERENGELSAVIDVRNGSPRPQKITLQAQDGGEQALSLASGDRTTVRFHCPVGNPYRGLLIQGSVESPFFPTTEGDSRRLGVQLFTGSPSELVAAREVDNTREGE